MIKKLASKLIILVNPGLRYHIKNKIPLQDNIYRHGSVGYFNLYKHARLAGVCISPEDKWFLDSDLGIFAEYEGMNVPLDFPLEEGAASSVVSEGVWGPLTQSTEEVSAAVFKGKDVDLNKPKRGGSKKFYVYVKDGDKVKKVSFGQPGVSIKNNDDDARKSFLARHRCHECKSGSTKCPKTSARYWSCNVHRYAKQLGLKSTKPW